MEGRKGRVEGRGVPGKGGREGRVVSSRVVLVGEVGVSKGPPQFITQASIVSKLFSFPENTSRYVRICYLYVSRTLIKF